MSDPGEVRGGSLVQFACPGCGAGPERQAVGAARIDCDDCAGSRAFRRGDLWVVTGCPGTGKSTVGRVLAPRLPLGLVVLDTDLTARSAHDASSEAWLGFIDTWLRTAVGAAQSGHAMVLVGYSDPSDWDRQPLRRFLGEITFVALTCTDAELEDRLRRRSWMDTAERSSLLDLNRRFRLRRDVSLIDTTDLSPEQAADAVLDELQRSGAPLVAWPGSGLARQTSEVEE